ncbi:unnamed protein product [Bursaphelenchus okinawaensis]|uniref:Uncharacterized protein n=1 Tax=Bursaphelenchus okinawaensis TaxID=465554 RepID=A0A811JUI9_9BILA|nr:unnamed protein product [Bursaphelenchus okinawaensis]CAG9083714.1 unnamed protein product [Bursaphelenchus okinawaensis]
MGNTDRMQVAATSASSASQSPQTLYTYASFGRGDVLARDPKLNGPVEGQEDDLDSNQLAPSSSLTQSPNIEHSPFRSDIESNVNLDSFDQLSGSSGTAGATPRDDQEPTSSHALELSVNGAQVRRLKRLAVLNGSLLRKCGVLSVQVSSRNKIEKLTVGRSNFSRCNIIAFPPAPRPRKFPVESVSDLQKRTLGTPGPSGESRRMDVKYIIKPNEVPVNTENPMLMSMLNKNGPVPEQARYVPVQPPPMVPAYGPGSASYKMSNGEVHEPFPHVDPAKFNGHSDLQGESAPSPKKPRKSRAKKPKEEQKPPEPTIRAIQPQHQMPQQVPPDYYIAHQQGMQQHQQRVPPMHLAPQYRPAYPGYPQQHQGMPPGGPQRVFVPNQQYPQQMWTQVPADEKQMIQQQQQQQQMRMQQMQGYPGYHYNQPMNVDEQNRPILNGRVQQQVISPQEMEFRRQQQMRMQMQQQQNMQRMPMPPQYPQTPGPSKDSGMKQEYELADNVDDLMPTFKSDEAEDFDLESIVPSKLEQPETKPKPTKKKATQSSKAKKQSEKKELDELEKAMKRNPDDPLSSPLIPDEQGRMIGSAIDCVMERVMREQQQGQATACVQGQQPTTSVQLQGQQPSTSSHSQQPCNSTSITTTKPERTWPDGPDLPHDVPQPASSDIRRDHSSSSSSTSNPRDDFSAPSSVPDYQHQEGGYRYGMYGDIVQNGNQIQYPVQQSQKAFPAPDHPYHGEFDKNWDFLEPNNGSQRSGEKELHDIRVEQ